MTHARRGRRVTLGQVLLHCSLIALPGCDYHDELTAFASFTAHDAEIDRCLNGEGCSPLWCEGFVPESDQVDLVSIDRCEVVSETATGVNVEIEYTTAVYCGRRPCGFIEPARRITSAAAWLATVATLEAASITAFERLVAALVRGPPRARVDSARRAARCARRAAALP